MNEPWDRIPLDVLKDFYWQSYQIVQNTAPHWITVLHDSFRLTVGENKLVFLIFCFAGRRVLNEGVRVKVSEDRLRSVEFVEDFENLVAVVKNTSNDVFCP